MQNHQEKDKSESPELCYHNFTETDTTLRARGSPPRRVLTGLQVPSEVLPLSAFHRIARRLARGRLEVAERGNPDLTAPQEDLS